MGKREVRFKIIAENLVNKGVSAARKSLARLKSAASAVGSKLASLAKSPLALVGGFASLGGAATLAGKAISAAFKVESATVQFRVLLGSMDKARERMKLLRQFSDATPFETKDVVKASRLLQIFTGDVLATEKGLRLVGDAAAASGQEIGEVAFWVGRAYAAIKGGQPFGEASARLTEMGLLSAKARTQLEELQKSGASAGQIFGVLRGELGAYSGAMKELSMTGEGLASTLRSKVATAFQEFGAGLLGTAKTGLTFLIAKIDELNKSGSLREWGERAAGVLERVGGWIDRTAEKFEAINKKIEKTTRASDWEISLNPFISRDEEAGIHYREGRNRIERDNAEAEKRRQAATRQAEKRQAAQKEANEKFLRSLKPTDLAMELKDPTANKREKAAKTNLEAAKIQERAAEKMSTPSPPNVIDDQGSLLADLRRTVQENRESARFDSLPLEAKLVELTEQIRFLDFQAGRGPERDRLLAEQQAQALRTRKKDLVLDSLRQRKLQEARQRDAARAQSEASRRQAENLARARGQTAKDQADHDFEFHLSESQQIDVLTRQLKMLEAELRRTRDPMRREALKQALIRVSSRRHRQTESRSIGLGEVFERMHDAQRRGVASGFNKVRRLNSRFKERNQMLRQGEDLNRIAREQLEEMKKFNKKNFGLYK